MEAIYESTGCKVRVRGRGSGHLEQSTQAEAPTPLMLAVTAEHAPWKRKKRRTEDERR